MRQDELRRQRAESRQMELPGLGSEGEAMAKEARQWIREHPADWEFMVAQAKRLHRANGIVSMSYVTEIVRNERKVSVPNALRAPFARIMRLEHPELSGAFRTHESKCDGFAQ